MKNLAAALLLGLTLFSTSAQALNLKPHRILIGGDGPARERHYFQDDDKRLAFRIDGKMRVSGSSDVATFRFTDLNAAVMRLMKSPSSPNIPFSEKGPKSYEAVARTLLPSDATNVELAETKPGAVSINGWTSLQFIYTYEFFGLSYRRAITFLNFDANEQFIFDVSARENNFGNAYGRGYRVLNSLFELPLDGAAGPS